MQLARACASCCEPLTVQSSTPSKIRSSGRTRILVLALRALIGCPHFSARMCLNFHDPALLASSGLKFSTAIVGTKYAYNLGLQPHLSLSLSLHPHPNPHQQSFREFSHNASFDQRLGNSHNSNHGRNSR